MGALRLKLAERENLIKEDDWAPLWVVDFPLFEKDDEKNRFISLHHPFTSPNPDDMDLLNKSPEKVRSLAYDVVMNGYELGGGSIRIFDKTLQSKIFTLLGISNEEANKWLIGKMISDIASYLASKRQLGSLATVDGKKLPPCTNSS